MKSMFAPGASAAIIKRIDSLNPDSQRLWGKMDVAQMLAHCCEPLEGAIKNKAEKRGLISFLFGKIAKKGFSGDKTFKQNLPTSPSFLIKDTRVFEKEKERLKGLINQLNSKGNSLFQDRVHPFFGPTTPEEWDMITYKHLDHHLTQFGA